MKQKFGIQFFGGSVSSLIALAVGLLQCAATADQLDNWVVRKKIDPSANMIAYGNGRFVVVSQYHILASTNGSEWSAHLAPAYSWMPSALTYGNGQFLLCYSSMGFYSQDHGLSVYSSPDGARWTFRFFQPNTVDDITYRTAAAAGNGLFVASCQNLVLSTNLESWDTVLSNFSGSLAQLGFTDGLFMGLLWWGDMITSSDGWTWDYHLAPEEFPFSNMRRENGRFVSFRPGASDGSYAPALAVSQDGFDWSVTSMPEYTNSQILASSANTFFLLNTRSNGFYSSLDGISWQARTFGTNVAIADIVFGNGTYVAVGDGCILQSAPDTNAPPPMTPTIAVQSVPGITITGTVGWNYRIEYAENLENTNSFLPLTNLCLPSSPFMWVDTAAAGQPRRFYRATIAP